MKKKGNHMWSVLIYNCIRPIFHNCKRQGTIAESKFLVNDLQRYKFKSLNKIENSEESRIGDS